MSNKYVDFVSDEHFKKCVKHVVDAYNEEHILEDSELQRNGIDTIKMTFDMMCEGNNFKKWKIKESYRQKDKTVNNALGYFHQMLLGGVKGWTDLGVGDSTKLDLKKNDNSIFMELKNKYNTVNSDSLSAVRQKLERITNNFPNSTAYWAYVIEKNGTSGESEWNYLGDNNLKLRKIWGSKLYELITGKSDALEKTWIALPIAIKDVLNGENDISSTDMNELQQWFRDAFEK